METQLSIKISDVVTQLNALSLYVNESFEVVSLHGDGEILGLTSLEVNKDLFSLLPDALHSAISEAFKTNQQRNLIAKTDVNYFSKGSPRKLRLFSNLVSKRGIALYLLTFLPLALEDKAMEIEGDFQSLYQARKKLKISEERYNAYFENDPVIHLSVNPKTGRIAQCNKFALDKLEYSKEEVVGKFIYEIFTLEKKEKCLSLVEKFKIEGRLDSEEMEIQTKSGKVIPVILYTTAQYDDKGNIVLSRSTLVDISELKNIQKRLRSKKTRLELLNGELEQLVSTCSHDLQEPLATIKFAGDLLAKMYAQDLDQKGQDYLSYINEAVDRLSSQIKALLAHIRLGRDTSRQKVDTEQLVRTVIRDLGQSISNSRASILIDSTLPVLEAYEVELRLLFQNLISNAIKYAKEGVSPEIHIEAEECTDYFRFQIKDNGIGIPDVDYNEIFKIFNRVDRENSRKGDGVGLAHCDKIVRMHEGTISVSSEVNSGSVFTFTIKKDYSLIVE